MKMGALFSRSCVSLALLLCLLPTTQSWQLFQKPPPPPTDSPTQPPLAEIPVDKFSKFPKSAPIPRNPFHRKKHKIQATSPATDDDHYLASSFNGIPTLPPWWEVLASQMKSVVMYKPPVGIASIFVMFHFVFGRNKRFVQSLLIDDEQERSLMRKNKRKKRVGRSLDLDSADRRLGIGLGGVEVVRAELCIAALENQIIEKDDKNSVDTNVRSRDLLDPETRSEYASAAREALEAVASQSLAKEDYIEETLEPLSRLKGLYDTYESLKNDRNYFTEGKQKQENYDIDLLWMSAKVAEVRTLDALLRVLRERLIRSAARLSKKEKYRQWRLGWYDYGVAKVWKRYYRKLAKGKSIDDDRRNLQLTSAALKREMERLGEVQILLLNRPAELSETILLTASSATCDKSENKTNCSFDANGAKLALQQGENSMVNYCIETHAWTTSVKQKVNELITETITSVFKATDKIDDRNTTVGQDLKKLRDWASYKNVDIDGWYCALSLSENLSKARLMREQKFLPVALDVKHLWKKIDRRTFGIPSSLCVVGAAFFIHKTVYLPYWDEILDISIKTRDAIWGVIEFRFWNPLKDIVLDLLNVRPRLLDPYALTNEETSLDNMLKDLGIGDGTKDGRPEALAEAARMYEKELAQGAIKNLFRGGMVRLLLIQVQQLKTGLLQAMGSIDDLMDSNRLNVQLLAAIPAFLLVNFGTRLFFRTLYSLRSRDFVGLSNAKSEMADLLRSMERCLLLANHGSDFEQPESTDSNTMTLSANELGEFVLLMHQYLVILDFCSPPFPTKSCDSIHLSLQDLLMQGQLTTKRQLQLMQLINAKHSELMKYK